MNLEQRKLKGEASDLATSKRSKVDLEDSEQGKDKGNILATIEIGRDDGQQGVKGTKGKTRLAPSVSLHSSASSAIGITQKAEKSPGFGFHTIPHNWLRIETPSR